MAQKKRKKKIKLPPVSHSYPCKCSQQRKPCLYLGFDMYKNVYSGSMSAANPSPALRLRLPISFAHGQPRICSRWEGSEQSVVLSIYFLSAHLYGHFFSLSLSQSSQPTAYRYFSLYFLSVFFFCCSPDSLPHLDFYSIHDLPLLWSLVLILYSFVSFIPISKSSFHWLFLLSNTFFQFQFMFFFLKSPLTPLPLLSALPLIPFISSYFPPTHNSTFFFFPCQFLVYSHTHYLSLFMSSCTISPFTFAYLLNFSLTYTYSIYFSCLLCNSFPLFLVVLFSSKNS